MWDFKHCSPLFSVNIMHKPAVRILEGHLKSNYPYIFLFVPNPVFLLYPLPWMWSLSQVAVKNNIDVFYFSCQYPISMLFVEDGKMGECLLAKSLHSKASKPRWHEQNIETLVFQQGFIISMGIKFDIDLWETPTHLHSFTSQGWFYELKLHSHRKPCV